MSHLALIATIMIVSTSLITTVSAAETGSTTGTGTSIAVTQKNETPLLLSTITVNDGMKITLLFNQAIQVDSLRVRIIDQATNESIKIATITGSLDPMAAIIKTSTPLTAGASYVLTITSALSSTDMTINAGIDSIREFAVPVNISGVSLNAPSNPNAVIVPTGKTTTPKATMTSTGSATGATILQNTEALPATGTPTVILIILAAISALTLLLVRKRA